MAKGFVESVLGKRGLDRGCREAAIGIFYIGVYAVTPDDEALRQVMAYVVIGMLLMAFIDFVHHFQSKKNN